VQPLEETEASWVPDYFGEEYLRLYQFPEERTGPEVAFLVKELTGRIPTDGKVLDLACGQGRHAVPLAKQGFRVTGLDYQQHLLNAAARYAREQHVELSLVRGDMRQLPFDETFDAVVNIFTAFGYFSDEENARVLDEVARVLRPGGWFIIDVVNRDALVRQAQHHTWKRLPDESIVLNEWTWDPRSGRYTHWQLLVAEGKQRSFQHSVRVYTCTELTHMLRDAGLTAEAVHGGFRGEALSLDSPRMICIARKKK